MHYSLLTNKLTDPMENSPWEANSHWANQEILHKEYVQFQGPVEHFVTSWFFTARSH
jgi:hypothetical protein